MGYGQHARHRIASRLAGCNGLLQRTGSGVKFARLALRCALPQVSQSDHAQVARRHQFQGALGSLQTAGSITLDLAQIGNEGQALSLERLDARCSRVQVRQGRLRLTQVSRYLPKIAAQQVQPGKIEGSARAGSPPFGRQRLQPGFHAPYGALVEQFPTETLQQGGSLGIIRDSQGMFNRFGGQTIGSMPDGRAAVQFGQPLGLSALQLAAQQAGKQVVVAVPARLVIQRDQEQVSRQQFFQQRGAAAAAGHGIAQFAGQSRQDGGLQQERLYLERLDVQHFLGQVTQDKAVAAAE